MVEQGMHEHWPVKSARREEELRPWPGKRSELWRCDWPSLASTPKQPLNLTTLDLGLAARQDIGDEACALWRHTHAILLRDEGFYLPDGSF